MTKIESTNAELIAAVRDWEGTEFGVHKMMSVLAARLEAAEAELTRSALPSKDTLDRCLCTAYSQDAGGGYFEPMVEQDPACPVHSEYVFDPKVAAWVHRESLAAVPERTLTDADLDRFETTAVPIYRSTVEAEKASKFLVSGLAQWVIQLTAEVRRLAADPVSLEAAKAETTTEWGFVSTLPDSIVVPAGSRDVAELVERSTHFQAVTREVTEWRPVSTEGDNRG
jgi:hypothetical protein